MLLTVISRRLRSCKHDVTVGVEELVAVKGQMQTSSCGHQAVALGEAARPSPGKPLLVTEGSLLLIFLLLFFNYS